MKHLLIICLLLSVAGCVTTPPISTEATELAWQARQALLQQQQVWTLQGRIAVSLDDEGWQAGLHWRQRGDAFVIELIDPLGRKVARFEGDPTGVVMTTSKGQTAYAATAEELMQRQTGFSLPLTGLRYWVLGLPDPAATQDGIALDGAGRLSQLSQSGWDVAYQQYQAMPLTELPRKINLTNQQLNARLIVKDWFVPSP